MAKDVYVAGVGLTKVDLTGNIFASVFDPFAEAYRRALQDSPVRAFDAVEVGIMGSKGQHPGGYPRGGDDGDQYFQIPRGCTLGLGGLMERVRRRVRSGSKGEEAAAE